MAEEAIESLANSLKKFTFWGTQPVPAIEENVDEAVNEPIELDKPSSEVRQEPYNLPEGFEWNTLDIDDSEVVSPIAHWLCQCNDINLQPSQSWTTFSMFTVRILSKGVSLIWLVN